MKKFILTTLAITAFASSSIALALDTYIGVSDQAYEVKQIQYYLNSKSNPFGPAMTSPGDYYGNNVYKLPNPTYVYVAETLNNGVVCNYKWDQKIAADWYNPSISFSNNGAQAAPTQCGDQEISGGFSAVSAIPN